MSISSISNYQSLYQANAQTINQNQQQNLANLGNAIQSGNISGAQQALLAFEQVLTLNQNQNPNGPNSSSATNPLNSDLTSLSNALQSQNTASAQADFNQLLEDLQSVYKGHHHHHHHSNGNINNQYSGSNASNSTSNGSSGGSGTGGPGMSLGSSINISV